MTEGPENQQPAFTPGFMVELAAAEVSDVQIDSPEYKKLRYVEPPKNGDLETLVDIHSYVMEHAGEPMTQTQIALSIGSHQPVVSTIMKNYPGIFIRVDKTYTVAPLPETFRQEYQKRMEAKGEPVEHALRTQLDRIERNVNKLLKQANTNSSRQNVTARPFLDEAIIAKIFDKYKMDIADSEYDYSEYTTMKILAVMYRMIRVLDKDVPGAMQVISELFTD